MDQIEQDSDAAMEVAHEARDFRETVRWSVKKNDPDRQARIQQLLDAIDDAMKPVRSHIGRLVHEPIPASLERSLRKSSAACQYERRQLKKMR